MDLLISNPCCSRLKCIYSFYFSILYFPLCIVGNFDHHLYFQSHQIFYNLATNALRSLRLMHYLLLLSFFHRKKTIVSVLSVTGVLKIVLWPDKGILGMSREFRYHFSLIKIWDLTLSSVKLHSPLLAWYNLSHKSKLSLKALLVMEETRGLFLLVSLAIPLGSDWTLYKAAPMLLGGEALLVSHMVKSSLLNLCFPGHFLPEQFLNSDCLVLPSS